MATTGYRPFRQRLSRRTALALGGSAAFLAACGGGAEKGGGTSSGSSPSTSSQATTAPAPGGGSNTASLVGRTGQQATETPVRGGIFTQAQGANPQGLDPHRTSASATFTAVGGSYSRLMQIRTEWDVNKGNDRVIVPDLAASVESPDAQTWTVKLKPGVKFHTIAPVNGHEVEAEDVALSFQRGTTSGFPSAPGLTALDAAKIETPDKQTVIFKLKYPHAWFVNTLGSMQYGPIYPREIAADKYDPNKTVIGSGPFIFESYTPDVSFTLKRNPDYYNKELPYVDGVKVAIVPDANQQWAQFQAGNIDYFDRATDDTIDGYTKQLPTAEVISNWGPGDGQIYMHHDVESGTPFRDIRLRRAMSLALDRDALSQIAFRGKATPTFYSPQSLGKWSLKMDQLPAETAPWYKFNLQQAKQLASAAGAEKLEIKYQSPTPYPSSGEFPWFKSTREATYNMLQALPWKISLVLLESQKDWIAGGKGARYGFYPGDGLIWAGLEGHQDVDGYIVNWYGAASVSNISKLNDAKLEEMILKQRGITNEEERLKVMLDLQKYMAEQMFSVAGNPNGLSYRMVGPRVRNYKVGEVYGGSTGTWAQLWLKK